VTYGKIGKMRSILASPSWKAVGGGVLMFGNTMLLHVRILLMLSGRSVPVSKLPQLVYETKKDLQRSGIVSILVGHVGDG
jgi:hypothetical protein